MSTRGVIFVHSSPTAVCPHVEWAISGVLGTRVSLEWTAQPAAPGLLRTECTWSGPAGSAGALAGALRAWPMLRFEVTEEPSHGVDGERFRDDLLGLAFEAAALRHGERIGVHVAELDVGIAFLVQPGRLLAP